MVNPLLVVICMGFWVTSGMIGCSRSPGIPGGKGPKAGGVFADPKVAELAEALLRSDLATSERLFHEGVDVNSVGKDGTNLPLWAMQNRSKIGFKWLFEHGADPNYLPKQGRGPLHLAAGADDPDWLQIILLHKPDVNLKYDSLKIGSLTMTSTPLEDAAAYQRKQNVQMLLAAGADINPSTPGPTSPLIMAAESGWNEGCAFYWKPALTIRRPPQRSMS